MKVMPQLADLTGCDHRVQDRISMSGSAFRAHVVPFEDLVVLHLAFALQVVGDPFIEVVTPVGQGVGELGFRFALSVDVDV